MNLSTNFVIIQVDLVLKPLVLWLIMYLIFLGVSFTILFFFPTYPGWVYKVKSIGTTQS